MNSKKITYKMLNSTDKEKISRRAFFAQSVGYTAGLALLVSPCVLTEVLAAKGDKSKEEVFKELDALVDEYLPRFGTCSQTSFYALNEVFELDAERFVKSLASMPGIAQRGETCGAVSGSLLAIAMVYEGEIFDDGRKGLSREPSHKFCTKFEEKYGSTRCRDVIESVTGKKYNLTKPEDYRLLAEEGAYEYCPRVIKDAVHFAAELILEKA